MRENQERPTSSRPEPPPWFLSERDHLSDSEVIVAVFRTVLVLVILFAPSINQTYRFSPLATAGVILASLYSLAAAIALYRHFSFRFQRPLVLIVDMFLLTFLIYFGGVSKDPTQPHRSQLFSLYQLLVIVAAIWFKVAGALITAAVASFTYLLVLMLKQAMDPWGPEFIELLSAQIPILFLVAMLSGYLAEAWDRERQRRLDAQRELADYRRNLELARDIQEILLPTSLPTLSGLDIGFRWRMAEVAGGDYYDVLQLPHNEVGFCIADVAGKSTRGQLRLPMFKFGLRACAHIYRTPAHTLSRLNQMLYPELQPDMFISMAYATLDARRRKLLYSNAGHVPALLFHAAEGEWEYVRLPGTVLGVEPNLIYSEHRFDFKPQDCLILYTDGLLDAIGPEGEEFGSERLLAILQNHPAQTAQELADYILSRLAEYERGHRRDDVTVLVVRRI